MCRALLDDKVTYPPEVPYRRVRTGPPRSTARRLDLHSRAASTLGMSSDGIWGGMLASVAAPTTREGGTPKNGVLASKIGHRTTTTIVRPPKSMPTSPHMPPRVGRRNMVGYLPQLPSLQREIQFSVVVVERQLPPV